MAIQMESPLIEAALEKIYARLGNLMLGEIIARIPALEEPSTEPALVVGEGEMEYVLFDYETGVQYPPELQPQITPSKSTFRYHQIKHPERLFHISGEFEASGIAQIDSSVLSAYNADNGTSFGDRPIDKIITPIENTSGRDIPFVFRCENDFINTSNGNVVDHVEPLFATWHRNSNEIELKFDKSTYSVPFGNSLTWDIKLSFWAIDVLDIEG